MGKELFFSATLHAIVIALLIVCYGGNVVKHPQIITIFLTDTGLPEGRGAAGKAGPAPVPIKPLSPAQAKQNRSPEMERSKPTIPGSTKPPAPRLVTDKDIPIKNVATALEDPTLSTFSDGALMMSAAPRDAAEGPGTGGETGAEVAGAAEQGEVGQTPALVPTMVRMQGRNTT